MSTRTVPVLIAFLLLATSVRAQPIPVNLSTPRVDMSGLWLSSEQPAHAVQIDVLDGGRVQLGWYTYNVAGSSQWLIGLGRVDGYQIIADLLRFDGGRPPLHWEQANVVTNPWGSVSLEFPSCDSALFRWQSDDPEFLAGELELTRYAMLQGQRCFAEELFSQQIIFSFERRDQNFAAVFADLPADLSEASYDLDYRREELPGDLYGRFGLRLSGDNHSDDLAMLVKAPIRGLVPDQYYRVELDAEIASNVPTGCIGIGGSPGESVYLKLGAATVEPIASTDPVDGWLRLNIDYGQQSQSGANARVVGHLGNSYSCEDGVEAPWELKTVSTQGQFLIMPADASGSLWIFAGSDSGFEGLSRFYITAIRVRLEPYE